MKQKREDRKVIKRTCYPQISQTILNTLLANEPVLRAYNYKESKRKISYLNLLPKNQRERLQVHNSLKKA